MGEPPCYLHLVDEEGRIRDRGLRVRRVYEPPGPADGRRVLVDRIWPRGLHRDALHADLWLKELAPSAALRRWFGHRPERWPEFRRRYREELAAPELEPALAELAEMASRDTVTLLYAARDEERNNAVVLREALAERLA